MKTMSKTTSRIVFHAGLFLFSLLAAMWMKYSQTGNPFVPETILATIIIFVTSVLTGYLAHYFIQRGNRLSHHDLNKRIVPAFLVFLVCVVLIANLTVTLAVFFWYLILGIDLQVFLSNLFAYELSFVNKSLTVWLVAFTIVFFYLLWRKSASKEQVLREENLRYRYNTLKAQVNPHFLFNSLSTLSELIYEDTGRADSYIQQLSKVYRYILENGDTDLVPLTEELAFVQQYFGLQQERAKGKICLEVNIPDAEKYKIIPVSLQVLVENALKHNAYSEEAPLQIDITMHEGSVVVTNRLQKKGIMEPSHGTGLSNLAERVKLVTGRDLSYKGQDRHFMVSMPVISA